MLYKLSVIMPVFNEAATILKIIAAVQAVALEKELIIVCDSSTDGTRELLQDYQKKSPANVKIYYFEKNCGKGAALAYGLKQAQGEYVIIQDADLEYDPQDYLLLLNELKTTGAPVVYGSRFLRKNQRVKNSYYLGNKILTFIFNLIYHTRLTDLETCYKMFRRETIQKIELKAKRFDIEPEITAKIVKQKIKIVEIPINYQPRDFSQGKKISWRDGLAAVWAILMYRIVN